MDRAESERDTEGQGALQPQGNAAPLPPTASDPERQPLPAFTELPPRIGPYEVLGGLGAGGMGAVLRARDPYLGREVAIKIPAGRAAQSEPARERFRREARALARLRHPHIVPLLAAGEEGGAPYLVLELVAGETLEERLRRGPLPPAQAADLVRKLAAGVAHAHRQGVLHRDIKPANVLLDAAGEPALTDFGLTRDLEAVPDQARLTRTGQLLGTPGFVAPEQADGQLARLGPATDVYGLGATLYAALTAAPPRAGDDPIAQLTASGPIAPPHELVRGVPPWLSRVCLRCLEDEPERRYPSAEALSAALASAAPGGRGARAVAIGASLGLGLGLLGGWVAGTSAPRAGEAPGPRPHAPGPPAATPRQEPAEPRGVDTSQLERSCAAGNHRDALRALSAALEGTPRSAALWRRRGLEQEHLARAADAERDYERALELDPDEVEARVARAALRIARGAPEHLEAELRAVLAQTPRHARANGLLGQLLYAQGRREAAEPFLEAAILAGAKDPLLLALRGSVRERAGDAAGAERDYRAYLAAGGQDTTALRNLAAILLGRGVATPARELLERAVRAGDRKALLQLGNCLASLREWRAAQLEYERFLKFFPGDADALVNLSMCHYELGEYALALTYAQRAYPAQPNPETLTQVGRALLALGRLREARDCLEQSTQKAPQGARAWVYLGEVYLAIGEPSAARRALERACQAGGAALAVVLLARAQVAEGDVPSARRTISDGLALLTRIEAAAKTERDRCSLVEVRGRREALEGLRGELGAR
ncbi:MAG: protein kinase [Planctomycetota bacterium]